MDKRVAQKLPSTERYVCDECFELFEFHASMARSDAYAKHHRVRCPHCASEKTRRATPQTRRSHEPRSRNGAEA